MDLETENRIAAILLKEAAELRRQAQQEGVLAYLREPQVRGRPNSRFLTATVLGVQQANRAVEENEMWRSRQKELELDNRLKGRFGEEGSTDRHHRNIGDSERSRIRRHADTGSGTSSSTSSKKRVSDDCYLREDDGLRDDEVEEFLHSRMKRGRGAVGSRMDETGPYLPSCTDITEKQFPTSDLGLVKERGFRAVLGPRKPASLRSDDSSEDESPLKKKARRSIQRSEKHKLREKSKDRKKKKKREEKRSKHRKK